MTALETYEHNGFTVTIEHDPDASNPREDASPGCALALFHRRYTLPNDPDVNPDDFAGWSEMADFLTRRGALYVMAVFMIDHSGLALNVAPIGAGNPFRDPWDSGQLGLAYITPEIWTDCHGTDWDGSAEQLAQAQQLIEAEVETYGYWLNGETYAYTITDEHGSERADCCGFLGWDAVTEAANEAADGLEHTAAVVRKSAADLTFALAQFDATYGSAVTNALKNQAKHMHDGAAECQAALDGTAPPRPVIKLNATQVQQFREAAHAMATRLGEDSDIDIRSGAAALLDLIRELILPEPPAKGMTINLSPTESGVQSMVQMFTEAAGRADAALTAYEELAGQAELLASGE
jgi:hypothetical protein